MVILTISDHWTKQPVMQRPMDDHAAQYEAEAAASKGFDIDITPISKEELEQMAKKMATENPILKILGEIFGPEGPSEKGAA